jgi:4'-phosphopantetheinyl transferase
MSTSLYWLSQTAADVPDDDDWLSVGERDTLGRMRFPKRHGDWRLGRWTAKQAVRAWLKEGFALSFLEIRAAADGAPEAFFDGGPADVSISISHSGSRGFCVVGPRDVPIGCDLELVDLKESPFFEEYFTPEEMAFTERAQPSERPMAAFLIWSAKETTLKILREGLRRDTRTVSIQADFRRPEGSWKSWTGRCLDSPRIFQGWWRSGEGYIYTLASNRDTAMPEPLRV